MAQGFKIEYQAGRGSSVFLDKTERGKYLLAVTLETLTSKSGTPVYPFRKV